MINSAAGGKNVTWDAALVRGRWHKSVNQVRTVGAEGSDLLRNPERAGRVVWDDRGTPRFGAALGHLPWGAGPSNTLRKVGMRWVVMEVTKKKVWSEYIPRWPRGCANAVCEGCHKRLWRIPKRYTGPKGPRFGARSAALKGPLFHGIIGGIARRRDCWSGASQSGPSGLR